MLSLEVHQELDESDPLPARQRYEHGKVVRPPGRPEAMASLREASLWRTHAVGLAGPAYWAPALPPDFIRRDRLEGRLSEALGRRLTVVTGVAGAGKSVLLAGWARSRAGRTVWLGLEEADNDPVRFWERMVGALRVVDPGVGDNVLAALSLGVNDAEIAEVLVGELAAIVPSVLVLDDLHLLAHPGLTSAVEYVAGHLPAHVHLVVATRPPCPLGLRRLRMSCQLAEIDDRELRFGDDEARRLLWSAPWCSIPPDAVEMLARVEGWAAGLRLVALALASSVDPCASLADFGGHSLRVADYFQHEVLALERAETVQFMLDTSVLETMTVRLCEDVSGRADAGSILEDLAGRHLFVLRTDAVGLGYRYHHLFAQFLRMRLAAQDPTIAGRAHLRAAEWFQRQGDNSAAFHHLVQGRAYDRAFALGASGVVLGLRDGQPAPGAAPLLGELPQSYLEQDPWRMYVVAAALLCQRRITDAAGWLHRLTRSLAGHSPAGTNPGPRLRCCGLSTTGCAGTRLGCSNTTNESTIIPAPTGISIPVSRWMVSMVTNGWVPSTPPSPTDSTWSSPGLICGWANSSWPAPGWTAALEPRPATTAPPM